MATILILIGVLFIVLGVTWKKEEKRRSNFEDYTWFQFEDHGWNRRKKHRHKR